MKKALVLVSGSLAVFAVPLISFAAINNISDLGAFIISIINNIIVPVLFAVAFIVFLWGAFKTFILSAGDGDVATSGRNLMLWGLIGFFVMVSIWGLVNILTGTITFGNNMGPNGGIPKAGVQVGG